MRISNAELTYRLRGKTYCQSLTTTSFDGEHLSYRLETQSMGGAQRLLFRLTAKVPLELQRFTQSFHGQIDNDDRLFLNGYQSWTESREYEPSETMPPLSQSLAPLYAKHRLDCFGDSSFVNYSHKKGVLHGFSYTYIRRREGPLAFFGSLGEDTAFTVFHYHTRLGRLEAQRDLIGEVADGDYLLLDLFREEGTEQNVFAHYFDALGLTHSDRPSCTGWTSWYNYYTHITEDILLQNLEALAARKIPMDVFQIDDGFQTAVGDWFSIKKEFPRGMGAIASAVKQKGYQAGLWLAPFICDSRSTIYRDHPDWISRDAKGAMVVAGNNIDHWGGLFYALDFYNPEVRAYLEKVFRTVLDQWGFDLVKLDFLYAVCLQPRPGKSRGRIMAEAMDFLRALVGPKKILGCGVPLASAFGRVDYCRIGCDVSLDWEFNDAAMVHYRERVSTISALVNTIGRRQIDRRAFLSDPDVFMLRTENTKMSTVQKHTLCLLNQVFGSLVFFSDNVALYTQEQSSLFAKLFPLKPKTDLTVHPLSNKKSWRHKGPIKSLVTGYDPFHAAYRIDFAIEGQRYQVWTNLGGHPRTEQLGQGYFFRSDSEEFYAAGADLQLQPYETVVFLISDGSPGSLAGTSGHIFPGCELSRYKAQNGKIQTELEKGVLTTPHLYVWGQNGQTVTINEQTAHPVKTWDDKTIYKN